MLHFLMRCDIMEDTWILGIDPGPTAGVCLFNENTWEFYAEEAPMRDVTHTMRTIGYDETDRLHYWFMKGDTKLIRLIVIEDFVSHGGIVGKPGIDTAKHFGALAWGIFNKHCLTPRWVDVKNWFCPGVQKASDSNIKASLCDMYRERAPNCSLQSFMTDREMFSKKKGGPLSGLYPLKTHRHALSALMLAAYGAHNG